MSNPTIDHSLVTRHIREMVDLGTIQSAANAGVIASMADEQPNLSTDRGRTVLSAKFNGILFLLSEQNGSIFVHAMDFPPPIQPALRGKLTSNSSLDEIGRLLQPAIS